MGGIRYQILYSLLRAFDIYDASKGVTEVRLEGIEDVDLKRTDPVLRPIGVGSEYVQVKSSGTSWPWSRLKEPVEGFLEAYRIDPDPNRVYVLAVDFALRDDIKRLAGFASLPAVEQESLVRKFRALCAGLEGSATDAEADGLLAALRIVSTPEEDLRRQLHGAIVRAFGLGGSGVGLYEEALVAQFLAWAARRATITRADLDAVRVKVGEWAAEEDAFREYQARGRGAIVPLTWEPDGEEADFWDGKATRPGHIASNADVLRPVWLDRMDQAVRGFPVCVVRASSGQGKSALAFRYAHDYWPPDSIFLLRSAQSREDTAQVVRYLRARAELGLPLLLIVDGADWYTREWPDVARECAAIGVRVLVTTREEDWHRFARLGVARTEVVTPYLDRDEARGIFEAFRRAGRVHVSVKSADQAFERVGEPRLLMEYVYLVTHGRMLAERLEEQFRAFNERGEDPAKIELLRRTALAHALGASLVVEDLVDAVPLAGDPDQTIRSLEGEYVTIRDGRIVGLHRIRSEHLADLLHGAGRSVATTALATLGSVPDEELQPYVGNALARPDVDRSRFMAGLADYALAGGPPRVLQAIAGVFEGGEARHFAATQTYFARAYDLAGSGGTFILAATTIPIGASDDIFNSLAGFANIRTLRPWAEEVRKGARGLDWVRDFLAFLGTRVPPVWATTHPAEFGRLLDWCALCSFALPAWEAARPILLTPAVLDLPLADLCAVTQGIHRYDPPAYEAWAASQDDDLRAYTILHTDSVDLNAAGGVLQVRFLVDESDVRSPNDAAVERLTAARRLFPTQTEYHSDGIWLLPFGVRPPHDDTQKRMPASKLWFPSDTKKNAAWHAIMRRRFSSPGYFEVQEAWYALRLDAVRFAEAVQANMRRQFAGRRADLNRALDNGAVLQRLATGFKLVASLPEHAAPDLRAAFRAAEEWASDYRNFLNQLVTYAEDPARQQDSGRLAGFNFGSAASKLRGMHRAFDTLFQHTPDYFGAAALDARERSAYAALGDVLDVWITEPVLYRPFDVDAVLRARAERRHTRLRDQLTAALRTVEAAGVAVTLASTDVLDFPSRLFGLQYSVSDDARPERELDLLVPALAACAAEIDVFWLVPVARGVRVAPGAYRISRPLMEALTKDPGRAWEALVLQDLPDAVAASLPPLDVELSARFEFRRRFYQFLAAADLLAQLNAEVQSWRGSDRRFDEQIRRRLAEQLDRYAARVEEAVPRVRDAMEAVVAVSSGPELGKVEAFLATWEHGDVSSTDSARSAAEAAERLLDKTA